LIILSTIIRTTVELVVPTRTEAVSEPSDRPRFSGTIGLRSGPH